MCGGSMRVWGRGGYGRRRPDFFGLDVERLGSRAKVGVALAVLAPVALSGVFLVAFAPGLWWIFTTYFWVSFPAIGLLVGGLAGTARGTGRFDRAAAPGAGPADPERDLLVALSSHGEMTAAGVAAETSLSVAEADRRLRTLAEAGHLEMRVRGGGIFYALWGFDGASPAGEV